VAGGPEHLSETIENLVAKRSELCSAMVDRGPIDRAQHAIGDIGGPRDLEEMASAAMRHRHTLT
jgi:hypothetical protein